MTEPVPGAPPPSPAGPSPTAGQQPARRIGPEDARKAFGLRSRYLAERLLEALDPWKTGFQTVADLHAVAQTMIEAPVDRKLAFLFRLHDVDGDGRIDREELERMLHLGLAESGITVPEAEADRLLATLLAEADLDHDRALSCDEFRTIIERRPELQARLAAQGVALLTPRKPAERTRRARGREALGWVRHWGVLGVWLGLFVAANLWLFVDAFATYRAQGANLWIQIARGCGACLNLDAPLLLVPMLRHLWTIVRRTFWHRVLPLDESVTIHRVVAEAVFGLSLVHAAAHLINVAVSSATLNSPANLTGFTLLGILALMWLCARDRVRAAGYFELFHNVHLLYWPWFVVALLHGPNLWKWLLLPGGAYLLERYLRRKLVRPPVRLLDARPLASGVTMLRFERPADFAYQPGDFVYIRVPAVAGSEWHPFTLTSAPEDPAALSVHVRSLGNWTAALRERFAAAGSHAGHRIHVDGPYGTPTAHIRECEHVVCVAAGIGVTPFASVLTSLHAQRRGGAAGFRVKRLHFVWISREQDSFEWFTQLLGELEADNADRWLDIHIYFSAARAHMEGSVLDLARTILHETTGTDLITGLHARTHSGRPDFDALLRSFAAEPLPAPHVFFCGPTALARSLEGSCRPLALPFRFERF